MACENVLAHSLYLSPSLPVALEHIVIRIASDVRSMHHFVFFSEFTCHKVVRNDDRENDRQSLCVRKNGKIIVKIRKVTPFCEPPLANGDRSVPYEKLAISTLQMPWTNHLNDKIIAPRYLFYDKIAINFSAIFYSDALLIYFHVFIHIIYIFHCIHSVLFLCEHFVCIKTNICHTLLRVPKTTITTTAAAAAMDYGIWFDVSGIELNFAWLNEIYFILTWIGNHRHARGKPSINLSKKIIINKKRQSKIGRR